MARYRKKPVEIEAVQNLPAANMSSWLQMAFDTRRCVPLPDGSVSIETLEGKMIAAPGDFIIRGITGEIYPCKPDIFHATYEPTP